jgi:hypothetical protein
MNVNELADALELASSDMEYNYHVSDWKLLYECAVVLRKLQTEIEALKAQRMRITEDGRIVPVFQTLTDEEILTIFNDCKFHINEETEKFNIYNFAKAILKKAQEK